MQMDRRFLDVRLTIDAVVTAPTKTAVGTQYLVAATNATGDFLGKENQIAYRTANGWKFFRPAVGQMEVFSLNDFRIHRYEDNSGSPRWVSYDIGSGKVKGAVISLAKSGVVSSVEDLPETAVAGEKFIDTASHKVYTATGADTWDEGADASIGDRYASITDHKIYFVEPNTTAFSVESVADGEMFVVKSTDDLYTMDGDNDRFQNLTNIADNPIYKKHSEVDTHTLTAEEFAAKKFDLSRKAELDCGVVLSVNGVVQVSGVDFVVVNEDGKTVSTVAWLVDETHYTLDSLVDTGDVFVVSYSTVHDVTQTYDA